MLGFPVSAVTALNPLAHEGPTFLNQRRRTPSGAHGVLSFWSLNMTTTSDASTASPTADPADIGLARLPLGQVVPAPGALPLLEKPRGQPFRFLARPLPRGGEPWGGGGPGAGDTPPPPRGERNPCPGEGGGFWG